MEKKLIGFFLLSGFLAVSTFTIFANGQKEELTKITNDYLSEHFMPAYHRLDLRSQGLTKIPNICDDYRGDVLLDIRSIDLGDNQISSIDNDLGCLIHLQELDLSYNKIQSVEKLGNLSNLVSLQLQNNQIKKISGINRLEKLLSLDLSNNQIQSTQGISDIKSLQELQLQNNQISDISYIKALKNLKILKLDSNQISPNDIKSIQAMPDIQDLSF